MPTSRKTTDNELLSPEGGTMNGESLLSFAQRLTLMAVSGADRQSSAGGYPPVGGDSSGDGRPKCDGPSQTFDSDSPTLSRSFRPADRKSVANATDNAGAQVLDGPVEASDCADIEPPAIGVFSGSAAVADGSSEVFSGRILSDLFDRTTGLSPPDGERHVTRYKTEPRVDGAETVGERRTQTVIIK